MLVQGGFCPASLARPCLPPEKLSRGERPCSHLTFDPSFHALDLLEVSQPLAGTRQAFHLLLLPEGCSPGRGQQSPRGVDGPTCPHRTLPGTPQCRGYNTITISILEMRKLTLREGK